MWLFLCITKELVDVVDMCEWCLSENLLCTIWIWGLESSLCSKDPLMCFSEWIKRSSLKIICYYSKLVLHKKHSDAKSFLLPLHTVAGCSTNRPGTLRPPSFPTSASPPFCADYKLRCKTESQQSKQNKPSAVFAFALTQKKSQSQKAYFLPTCLPFPQNWEKIRCLQGINSRSTMPHISIYISSKLSDKTKQERTLHMRPESKLNVCFGNEAQVSLCLHGSKKKRKRNGENISLYINISGISLIPELDKSSNFLW